MRWLFLPAIVGVLAGCAAKQSISSHHSTETSVKVEFASLPGWPDEKIADAIPGFVRGCARLALAPPDQRLGSATRGGQAADWHDVCRKAASLPPGDEAAARAFLTADFDLVPLTTPARFSGFYEPEVDGSREKVRAYTVAALRRPQDMVEQTDANGIRHFGRLQDGSLVPYYTRAEIDNGVLRHQRLDLVYLRNATDLYFMQVQGAGRVDLPNGRIVRLGYDSGNGQPYAPIGRLLSERGTLTGDEVNTTGIRNWLESHPREAKEVMQDNPSYTFFRETPDLADDMGPVGALGVQLQPLRSIAVDPALIPLGAPVWIATALPDGRIMNRLMLAQDTDGALAPALQADIFFGWGRQAEMVAGEMNQSGRAWVLLPRSSANPPS